MLGDAIASNKNKQNCRRSNLLKRVRFSKIATKSANKLNKIMSSFNCTVLDIHEVCITCRANADVDAFQKSAKLCLPVQCDNCDVAVHPLDSTSIYSAVHR